MRRRHQNVQPQKEPCEGPADDVAAPQVSINEGEVVKGFENAWKAFKEANRNRLAVRDMKAVIYGGATVSAADSRSSGRSKRWTRTVFINHEGKIWRESEIPEEKQIFSTLGDALELEQSKLLNSGTRSLGPAGRGGCDSVYTDDLYVEEVLRSKAGQISAMSAETASSTAAGTESVNRILQRALN